MPAPTLTNLLSEVSVIDPVWNIGRITAVDGALMTIRGLTHVAGRGDQVAVELADGSTLLAEITALDEDVVHAIPDGLANGVPIGAAVRHLGPLEIAPDDSWIGRIVDPSGLPLDGRPLFRGADPRALDGHPPPAAQRRRLGARLSTGMAVFNTLLPIVRGQRIGLFAGSGVGKSSLLAHFAKALECDIVVIAMIGERGRELREFVDGVLGSDGLKRSVIVAATSDHSALQRRRCAHAAMAVAEHFRDQGAHVLLLADSITRFADAHREIALAAGEFAGPGGHPPSMAHQIMGLAERAGPGAGYGGDITAVFSVLVPGSDMEEPVADTLRGVLDGHVVMDRAIAERGRFPAIDPLRSISRSLPAAATAQENQIISRARALLGTYDRAELMVQSGLYQPGSDPAIDQAIAAWPGLDAFIAEIEVGGPADSFARLQSLVETMAQKPVDERG